MSEEGPVGRPPITLEDLRDKIHSRLARLRANPNAITNKALLDSYARLAQGSKSKEDLYELSDYITGTETEWGIRKT